MNQNLLCAAMLVAISPWASASCGSAFCLVNSNWNLHGPVAEPGLRVDLRYEYLDQDQPRAGAHAVKVGEVHRHHDEVFTVNRNWLASFDYTFDQDWGLSLTVPVADRSHDHVHNHHGHQLDEKWDFRDLGDVRIVGRRQWMLEGDASLGFAGVTFGAKLPTGPFDLKNGEGDEAERSLQPGSGTTDLLLGAYYSRVHPDLGLSWFAQAQVQRPMWERQDYRPGSRFSIDLGLRKEVTERVGLMLQLNGILAGRDQGAEAESEDSGQRALFISPGLSVSPARGLQLYGFVQLPLLQKVNGVQLTADKGLVVGGSYRF